MNEKQNESNSTNPNSYSLNYVYYGLYFLVFAGLQIFHVLLIDPSGGGERFIYALYAGVQSFIEVLCMATVSSALLHRKLLKTHRIWILFLGILLLCRIIDFLLVRLMNLSIWEGMNFFFRETLDNIIEMLLATTITPAIWIVSFLACILLIISGWGLFHFAHNLYRKKPLLCSGKTLFGFFSVGFSLLTFNDLILHFSSPSDTDPTYTQALPWKRTLFAPKEHTLTVGGYLTGDSDRFSCRDIDSSLFSLERNPDIFLFIVETLREDFLTEEITPAVAKFGKSNTKFEQTLSVSNATPTSWFSIFYSTYPFYWTKYRNAPEKQGSPSLRLLQKMGYEIHVYSGSRLNFYSMRNILFGENASAVTRLHEFQSDTNILPYQADAAAVNRLCEDISASDKKGGRVFITFLDSTHFDYSWPTETGTVFTPVEDKVNYLKISYERSNLDKIANRYKNSLHYIDSLFANFRKTAEEKGLWNDSVVIFTADHGEELNEYGCMFHASNLSLPQINIPLYMKLASSSEEWALQATNKASQIDIFPTLFHYIIGENTAAPLFQGKSLFTDSKSPYLIGARYNGSLSPYQFYMQSGPYRMTAEFCNTSDIFHCNTLKVLAIENEYEEPVPVSDAFIHTHFGEGLNALFGSKK